MLLRPSSCDSQSLWCTTSQFHCWRKGNRGRSSNEAFHRHMAKLSLPYLARWLFTWRKAFFQQEQGRHTCLWQAWSAQNSQRRKPCAGRWPGTETVQMSLPTWYFQTNSACSSQYKFVLHQKEVCANLIKSLNLFHILTYEGIFSHHFPQWNCKWLVTRILAITTTTSWTTIFHSAYILSSWPGPFLLKVTPTPSALKPSYIF